jgi:hypothetical protein
MDKDTFDEYDMRKLPPRTRLKVLRTLFEAERYGDESQRWDCIWLIGEILDELPDDKEIRKEIADLMVWILRNDNNDILSHEAAFQIGVRNFEDKMEDLRWAALHHWGMITRHEAIEALGMARQYKDRAMIEKIAHDKTEPVPIRVTAAFVVKRLDRLKKAGGRKYEGIYVEKPPQ